MEDKEDILIDSLLHENDRVAGIHDEPFLADLETKLDQELGVDPTQSSETDTASRKFFTPFVSTAAAAAVIGLVSFVTYTAINQKESNNSSSAIALNDSKQAAAQEHEAPTMPSAILDESDALQSDVSSMRGRSAPPSPSPTASAEGIAQKAEKKDLAPKRKLQPAEIAQERAKKNLASKADAVAKAPALVLPKAEIGKAKGFKVAESGNSLADSATSKAMALKESSVQSQISTQSAKINKLLKLKFSTLENPPQFDLTKMLASQTLAKRGKARSTDKPQPQPKHNAEKTKSKSLESQQALQYLLALNFEQEIEKLESSEQAKQWLKNLYTSWRIKLHKEEDKENKAPSG